MKHKHLFILGYCLFLIACMSCQNSEQDEELHIINVRNCLENPKESMSMSALYSKISYIPLETADEALLHNINKVIMHKNFIFVSDNRSVCQFDETGKFIRTIGSAGSGPGEYIGMIRFSIDQVNDEVLIYSTKTHTLNAYDANDGTFLKSKELPFYLSDFSHLKNGAFAFFTREFNKNFDRFTIAEAYLLDNDREIVDSISNYNRYKIENYSMGYVNIYSVTDGVNYMYNFKDTLYQINKSFIRQPMAWFDFDNIDDGNILDVYPAAGQIQYSDFLWVSNLVGCSDYYYITVRNGFAGEGTDNASILIYNKNNRVVSNIGGLLNDIDQGMSFWPRWIQNDKLISFIHAHEILSFAENVNGVNQEGAFWQIADNLSENDNPVLVIVE